MNRPTDRPTVTRAGDRRASYEFSAAAVYATPSHHLPHYKHGPSPSPLSHARLSPLAADSMAVAAATAAARLALPLALALALLVAGCSAFKEQDFKVGGRAEGGRA